MTGVDALDIARLIAALSAVMGLVGVLRLDAAMRLLGLAAPEPRGRAELRATWAGFGAVAATAAFIHDTSAYGVLAALWGGMGVVRFISVAVDGVWTSLTAGSVVFEIAVCAALVVVILVA
jgi:hypothetical protein